VDTAVVKKMNFSKFFAEINLRAVKVGHLPAYAMRVAACDGRGIWTGDKQFPLKLTDRLIMIKY